MTRRLTLAMAVTLALAALLLLARPPLPRVFTDRACAVPWIARTPVVNVAAYRWRGELQWMAWRDPNRRRER